MHEKKVACGAKIKILLVSVTLVLIGWSMRVYSVDSETREPEPRISGGPCVYEEYKGQATILSIRKKEMPKGYGGGPSHDGYEVWFSFFPFGEIKEPHGKIEGKKFLMLLRNSWYPGPEFLEKYRIEEGKVFDCQLKVITKGTCTPIVFDFPDIDLSDYFESREQRKRR